MPTRDQNRALRAYSCVRRVTNDEKEDYKIAVNDFGSNILRSGLAATMALAERKQGAHELLLNHLAAADIPGFPGQGNEIPERVRGMSVADYMLATRETLKVLVWFKRAVQAIF